MDQNDRQSPVAMLVGGVIALVVGIIVLRWVLHTLIFFGKVAVLVVLVGLVMSAVARTSKDPKTPKK